MPFSMRILESKLLAPSFELLAKPKSNAKTTLRRIRHGGQVSREKNPARKAKPSSLVHFRFAHACLKARNSQASAQALIPSDCALQTVAIVAALALLSRAPDTRVLLR